MSNINCFEILAAGGREFHSSKYFQQILSYDLFGSFRVEISADKEINYCDISTCFQHLKPIDLKVSFKKTANSEMICVV